MRQFIKAFRGVRDGDIYPTDFAAGDECPPELVAGAERLGALAAEEPPGENGQSGAAGASSDQPVDGSPGTGDTSDAQDAQAGAERLGDAEASPAAADQASSPSEGAPRAGRDSRRRG